MQEPPLFKLETLEKVILNRKFYAEELKPIFCQGLHLGRFRHILDQRENKSGILEVKILVKKQPKWIKVEDYLQKE